MASGFAQSGGSHLLLRCSSLGALKTALSNFANYSKPTSSIASYIHSGKLKSKRFRTKKLFKGYNFISPPQPKQDSFSLFQVQEMELVAYVNGKMKLLLED